MVIVLFISSSLIHWYIIESIYLLAYNFVNADAISQISLITEASILLYAGITLYKYKNMVIIYSVPRGNRQTFKMCSRVYFKFQYSSISHSAQLLRYRHFINIVTDEKYHLWFLLGKFYYFTILLGEYYSSNCSKCSLSVCKYAAACTIDGSNFGNWAKLSYNISEPFLFRMTSKTYSRGFSRSFSVSSWNILYILNDVLRYLNRIKVDKTR